MVEPLIAGLSDLDQTEFDRRFRQLETGEIFRARGIENFLEGDFLGWYVDEWNPALRESIRALSRELQDFEPGTSSLRPELTQDLLKELYHRLLPRQLRHALGEYYTPDWLAAHAMDVSGYDGEPGTRILDPACGSGTFLVEAIRRVKQAASRDGLSSAETASAITSGIVGFDLNPLAVIAARTNYLLAAGELIGSISPFRIPVFICDSITVPAQSAEPGSAQLGKRLSTSVGDFFLPSAITAPTVLPDLMSELEFCADNEFPARDFIRRIAPLQAADEEAVEALYSQICDLKARGLDGIWPRLLSNAFAPLFAMGQFDHVIGNPPWIKWEEVSLDYRALTKPLWNHYGLFTLSGGAAMLGGGKKDMSMLMTYVAAEEYLRTGGTLTFLITQTVLQTSGAGDGFRGFETERRRFRVRSVDDLANFNPFDDAANWTALISLERDADTVYPVDYTLWDRRPSERIRRSDSLEDVRSATKRTALQARPVRSSKSSPWLIGKPSALSAAHTISGRSDYKAKAGVTVWLDGVFQVQVLGIRPDGLVRVRNCSTVGKIHIEEVEAAIEPDLLSPYVPWAEIKRWSATPNRFLLIPQDPVTRGPYPLETMRERWPQTLAYLRLFEAQLRNRSGFKRYFKFDDPFYAIYNVSRDTFAPRKVVWRTMGKDMQAAFLPESSAAAALDQKPTAFKNTVVFVPVESDDEGSYLTALLNSSWTNYLLRASNVRGGKSAFATNVLENIAIPKYRPRSAHARRMAALGRRASAESSSSDENARELTEVLIDEAAAEFWNIGVRQQRAIRTSLDALG